MRRVLGASRASFVTALFAFAAAFPACTGAPVLPFEVRSESKLSLADRRAIFADAWRTIGEKHFDETMGGLDWDAVPNLVAVSKLGGSTVTATTEKLELDHPQPASLFERPARR